ncbi:MAG TPA: hypothetical protein DEP29_06105 [Bifidobacterium sp.]|nr:hypothetical protein [Bifidobacterium sp.]HCA74557.1 hypothetical protein [Bifidobacterium sp.]
MGVLRPQAVVPFHYRDFLCSNNVMNTLRTFAIGNVLADQTCPCRLVARANQAIIGNALSELSKRLDELDSILAFSTLPGWSGLAAEAYRTQVADIHKQALALRDAAGGTSRLLWSAGEA